MAMISESPFNTNVGIFLHAELMAPYANCSGSADSAS